MSKFLPTVKKEKEKELEKLKAQLRTFENHSYNKRILSSEKPLQPRDLKIKQKWNALINRIIECYTFNSPCTRERKVKDFQPVFEGEATLTFQMRKSSEGEDRMFL